MMEVVSQTLIQHHNIYILTSMIFPSYISDDKLLPLSPSSTTIPGRLVPLDISSVVLVSLLWMCLVCIYIWPWNGSWTHMETYTTGHRTTKAMDDEEDRRQWRPPTTKTDKTIKTPLPSLYPSLLFSLPSSPFFSFLFSSCFLLFQSHTLSLYFFTIPPCLFYLTQPYHSISISHIISYLCIHRTRVTSGGHHSQG